MMFNTRQTMAIPNFALIAASMLALLLFAAGAARAETVWVEFRREDAKSSLKTTTTQSDMPGTAHFPIPTSTSITWMEIHGGGFSPSGPTWVSINGLPVPVISVEDDLVRCIVPHSAPVGASSISIESGSMSATLAVNVPSVSGLLSPLPAQRPFVSVVSDTATSSLTMVGSSNNSVSFTYPRGSDVPALQHPALRQVRALGADPFLTPHILKDQENGATFLSSRYANMPAVDNIEQGQQFLLALFVGGLPLGRTTVDVQLRVGTVQATQEPLHAEVSTVDTSSYSAFDGLVLFQPRLTSLVPPGDLVASVAIADKNGLQNSANDVVVARVIPALGPSGAITQVGMYPRSSPVLPQWSTGDIYAEDQSMDVVSPGQAVRLIEHFSVDRVVPTSPQDVFCVFDIVGPNGATMLKSEPIVVSGRAAQPGQQGACATDLVLPTDIAPEYVRVVASLRVGSGGREQRAESSQIAVRRSSQLSGSSWPVVALLTSVDPKEETPIQGMPAAEVYAKLNAYEDRLWYLLNASSQVRVGDSVGVVAFMRRQGWMSTTQTNLTVDLRLSDSYGTSVSYKQSKLTMDVEGSDINVYQVVTIPDALKPGRVTYEMRIGVGDQASSFEGGFYLVPP